MIMMMMNLMMMILGNLGDDDQSDSDDDDYDNQLLTTLGPELPQASHSKTWNEFSVFESDQLCNFADFIPE